MKYFTVNLLADSPRIDVGSHVHYGPIEGLPGGHVEIVKWETFTQVDMWGVHHRTAICINHVDGDKKRCRVNFQFMPNSVASRKGEK